MINEEKCRHYIEYVMGSKVCKRCGLIESMKSPLFPEPVPVPQPQ